MNCTKCGNALPESESPLCPFCGEQQGVTSSATPVTSGSFSATPVSQSTNPFGAPPQEKKGLPGWAIALIAGGIVFVLAICCCLAMFVFADDFLDVLEEFDEASSGITLSDSGTSGESEALIQEYIDTSSTDLRAPISGFILGLGVGGGVEFEAADGELIYIYTYNSPLYPYEGLAETLAIELSGSEWQAFYTGEATRIAQEIGLDELTITVRFYYGDDGIFLVSESFSNR